MLFVIREPLLRGPNDLSVMRAVLMDPETEGPCRDYQHCEYCNRTEVHLEQRLLQTERESDLSYTDNDESGEEQQQPFSDVEEEAEMADDEDVEEDGTAQ